MALEIIENEPFNTKSNSIQTKSNQQYNISKAEFRIGIREQPKIKSLKFVSVKNNLFNISNCRKESSLFFNI